MSRRLPVATLMLVLAAFGVAGVAAVASGPDDTSRSVPSQQPGADGAPGADGRAADVAADADADEDAAAAGYPEDVAADALDGEGASTEPPASDRSTTPRVDDTTPGTPQPTDRRDILVLPPDPDEPIDPGPEPDVADPIVSPEGFHVVAGAATAGAGSTVRYTVEVEPALDQDPLAVAAVVEEALHDPRSWAADVRLERVEDLTDADIRVVLARPATVDELCAQAGLNTAGRFSCWNGQIAALNAVRWEEGAAGFDDLGVYRRYLVNHEFGHGLGYGHVGCPAPGELAPVMMQQTMGTDGCVANGWVYPEVSPPE